MLFSANTAGAVCSAAGVGVCSAGAGVLELKAWRSLPVLTSPVAMWRPRTRLRSEKGKREI